jgi:hypothetical protein
VQQTAAIDQFRIIETGRTGIRWKLAHRQSTSDNRSGYPATRFVIWTVTNDKRFHILSIARGRTPDIIVQPNPGVI